MPNILVVLSLLVPAFAAAPPSESHPWARFKVGTWVKWKTVTVHKTGATQQTYESESLQTLVSLTSEKAVVEFADKGPGQADGTKTLVDLPLKASAADLALAAQAPKPGKTGTESLTIAGKTFACTWSETVTGDATSGRTTMRTWESDAMPGSIVKSVSTSEIAPGLSSVMTTEVVAFLIK